MSGRALAALVAGPVAVLVLAVAALPGALEGGGDTPDVPVYEVHREDFTRAVHADGNLEAVHATLLGPPPENRRPLKIAWLAQDGSLVEEGDVVIRFDPTDMEEELREGRNDRAATDSRITQKKALEEGNLHGLAVDAEIADLELEHARSFQGKDERIFSRNEIIESEIDEQLATRRKEHAEQAGPVQQELSRTELDLLAIERRKAELKIEQAQKGLHALEVRAPHDGIFVLKRIWGRRPEVGQMVWGGNAVAELPELEEMQAKVFVLEADAGGLAVGLPATVVLDAHPDLVFHATVSKADALAQRRNRESPVQYFGVTLALERTEPGVMKPGQRVRAVLTLDERPDVLVVPRQAVFEVEDKKVVYVRRGGRFAPEEVKLGPAALGRVVIEEGLAEGDRVALQDPTRPLGEGGEEETEAPPVTAIR